VQYDSKKIIEKGLVTGKEGAPLNKDELLENSGPSSIDLTIREIIYENSDGIPINVDAHTLKPQETVCVISEQEFAMDGKTVAYVFLKNSLSQAGLLAFNTGIVDSNYHGPISTLVTNYSKRNIVLKSPNAKTYTDSNNKEQFCSFFRVVFHRMQITSACLPTNRSYNDYLNERIRDFTKIPKEFLETSKLTEKISAGFKKEVEAASTSQKIWLGFIITGIVAVLSLVPMVAQMVLENTKFVPQSVLKKQEEYETKIMLLEDKLDAIEKELKKRNERIYTDKQKNAKNV